MKMIQRITAKIVESVIFRNFILGLIIASGILVGIETYAEVYKPYASLFGLLDRIILSVFVTELLLKFLAHGTKFWKFFTDPWNVFDFIVIAVCFIPGIDTHFVTVLRLARILRVFRIISVLPKLQILVNALIKSIPSMGYVVVLLSIVFYIYAVAGSFLFAKTDPVHFGSLHLAMISLFKILTLEGWTDIMNIQLYGTTDPMAEYNSAAGNYASVAYFVTFILFGAMIIMNLFIGVIMNSMQESQDDLKKMMLGKNLPEQSTRRLLLDLEQKIDGLKTDIQRLNETLKN